MNPQPKPSTAPTSRTLVPHRGSTAVLTLAVPLTVSIATFVWASTVRDRLPEPVAVHWGTAGTDGAGTFTELVVLPLAIIVPVMTIGLWALATFRGQSALTRRMSAALSVWIGVFVAGLTATTVAVQLDAAEWTQAGELTWGGAISLTLATALAVLAGWLAPGDAPQPTTTPPPASAARLPLSESEHATWVRAVTQSGMWVIAGLIVGVAVVTGLATRNVLFPGIVGATLGLTLVAMTLWTVTVDHRGLTATSRLGWPRLSVPLDEIESASVREVRPLREFGGWGLRTGADGTIGVVLRAGESIVVQRTGGRRVVVTVDDASTGVALLNTLASRPR